MHASRLLAGSMAQSLADFFEEFDFLDKDGRWTALIELGRELDPMPAPLKSDVTRVAGCSSSVWVYPTRGAGGRYHFYADSDSAITKGIVALVLMIVQERTAEEILSAPIEELLEPFELQSNLTSKRTQGVPNMIALIRETAARQG